MAVTSASIDFSGPFFQAVDPGETLLKNVAKMMQGIADEDAKAARTSLMQGASGRAMVRELGDRVADHVVGRVVSRTGRRWATAAVVQVYNEGLSAAESRSLMAAGSYVTRRTRTFSGLTRSIRSGRAVLTANLTAGLGD